MQKTNNYNALQITVETLVGGCQLTAKSVREDKIFHKLVTMLGKTEMLYLIVWFLLMDVVLSKYSATIDKGNIIFLMIFPVFLRH